MTPDQRTSGSPHEDLYDPAVAKMKRLSVEEARSDLGRMVDAGAKGELEEHFLITKHGRPGLVTMSIGEYRELRRRAGDPTEA